MCKIVSANKDQCWRDIIITAPLLFFLVIFEFVSQEL